jgi:hypothetical protein
MGYHLLAKHTDWRTDRIAHFAVCECTYSRRSA